jgi:hypothetical protein
MELKEFAQFVMEESRSSELKIVLDLLAAGILSRAEAATLLPAAQRRLMPHFVVRVEVEGSHGVAELIYSSLDSIAEGAQDLWIDMDSFAQRYRDGLVEVSFRVWSDPTRFDQESLEELFWEKLDGPILNIDVTSIDPA